MPNVSYAPAVYNIQMVAGDTFKETFDFTDAAGVPIDLDGYTFKSQVRQTAAGSVVAEMSITAGTASVTRSIGTAVTATLSGDYQHDLQWTTPDDEVRTLLAGRFTVAGEVTR